MSLTNTGQHPSSATGRGPAHRYVGQAVKRREDLPYLTGRARFVDDVTPARLLHTSIVRSPLAHARVLDGRRIPKAHMLPAIEVDHTVTPSPLNPLGVKGIGEAGTIGSVPAVVNAVVDALSPLGIVHLDMPLHPERVWLAIQAAKASSPPS